MTFFFFFFFKQKTAYEMLRSLVGSEMCIRDSIRGIHESSGKALRIMQITTVMVVAFLVWCPITLLLQKNVQLPPLPVPSSIRFSEDALGWFNGTLWPQIG